MDFVLERPRLTPAYVDEGDPDATSEPPRVLILGPENSGKTSLCKMLVNYASRVAQGWSPVVANLDPAEVSRADAQCTHLDDAV